jgi:hypothetical protein
LRGLRSFISTKHYTQAKQMYGKTPNKALNL